MILRDGAATHALNTKNLAKMIFNGWDKYPLVESVPIPQKKFVDDVVHPKDINGKEIFEADRVFIISDLTFGNVESTRKTSVVTYNRSDYDRKGFHNIACDRPA